LLPSFWTLGIFHEVKVSGDGLPVFSLPHWSGTRGEERRQERSKDKLSHGISASFFPQPLQEKGQVSN
jgi:hypothetical protein